MKILITGGRNFRNKSIIDHCLDVLVRDEDLVIVGDCPKGVDDLTFLYSRDRGLDCKRYVADWESYGKGAGPIRNRKMIKEEFPDFCIAFPGGKGTNNCVKQCKELKIYVVDLRYIER